MWRQFPLKATTSSMHMDFRKSKQKAPPPKLINTMQACGTSTSAVVFSEPFKASWLVRSRCEDSTLKANTYKTEKQPTRKANHANEKGLAHRDSSNHFLSVVVTSGWFCLQIGKKAQKKTAKYKDQKLDRSGICLTATCHCPNSSKRRLGWVENCCVQPLVNIVTTFTI